MMNLLKDYTKASAPEKVLLRKEVDTHITKFVNVISFVHENDNEEENQLVNKEGCRVNLITTDDGIDEGGVVNESCSNKGKEISPNEQPTEEPPKSQTLGYYLKHDINKKTIDNWMRNNGRNYPPKVSKRKRKEEEYDTLTVGPLCKSILKQKVNKKQMVYQNFEIPCGIGDLKYLDALADQGSEVNILPLSIYAQSTNKIPTTKI